MQLKLLSRIMALMEDWRRTDKDLLSYVLIQLPRSICDKLLQLMKHLGLTFGGIDLVLADNIYHFIEINPTGEWGWLVTSAAFAH